MGPSYWIRVAVMIFTFVALVVIIRKLDSPQPTAPAESGGFFSFFGGDSTPAYNLCPTRVSRVELASGHTIYQEGMKWYLLSGEQSTELAPIAVEKWFGANCKVRGEPAEPEGELEAVAQFSFVTGAPKALLRAASGEFKWNGETFRSPQLEEALSRLTTLPGRTIRARLDSDSSKGASQ